MTFLVTNPPTTLRPGGDVRRTVGQRVSASEPAEILVREMHARLDVS
jgi:hypothetical protein